MRPDWTGLRAFATAGARARPDQGAGAGAQRRAVPGHAGLEVVVRRSTRARRLTLRVSATDHSITLTAPTRLSERQIDRFLLDHVEWIRSRQASLLPLVEPGAGVLLPLEGEDVTLVAGSGSARRVQRRGGELAVPGEGQVFQARLRAFVKETARARAAGYCARYADRLGQPINRLTMRDPRSRWGSCTSAGNIMLSWRLLLAPPEVFAYVAAHEVAHLVEMNHSRAFWQVVERIHPDHQPQRLWLQENGAMLHRYRI